MVRVTSAAVVVACAIAGPARAAPTWLAPQNIFSTPVTSIQNDPFFNRNALDVVSDGEGDAVAVWIEAHPESPGPGTECQAMYAFRNPGQSFGAPQPLAPPMSFCTGQINAAMNAGDTTVVAWKQGQDVVAAIRPPGGPFTAPATLSASTATDDPWVSINDAGVTVVSWDDTNTGSCSGLTSGTNWAFHASVRQQGGSFGPFETVCDVHHPSGPTIFTPRAAVDQQGDIAATWVDSFNDGTKSHIDIESAYRPAGGSFTGQTPQVLSDMINPVGSAGSFAADIAVDDQGRATAVWPFFDTMSGKTVIQTAVRPPGASSMFGAAAPVSDPVSAGNSNSPRVAVDPSTNTAVAVWVQCPMSCQVESAARPSGGGFETPQALSAGGATTTFGPLVAFDPSGEASAVWSGPSPDVSGTQVQVAQRPAGTNQSFGQVTTISKDDISESPAIAFDGEGNAIAVWEHHTTTPTSAVLQYAGFDAAGPDISAVSTPDGVVGKPITFSATVADRWSSSATTWSFGDGGTATGPSVDHTYTKPGTYQVTITAQDAVGNQSSANATVTVQAIPRVSFSVRYRVRNEGRGRARFTSIVVAKLTRGAHVRILCIGKHKGCPFKAAKIKRTGGKANLAKRLRGRTLDAGAIVQVRATKAGMIGAVANLKVGHGTARLSRLCLPVGASKPRGHCG